MKFFRQNYVQYGLLLSAVTAICLILMTIGGTGFGTKSPLQQFFMIVMPFIVFVLGLRAKKREMKKPFTYKQGIAEGVRISAIYAVVSPLVFWLFYVVINPSLVDHVRNAYNLGKISTSAIISVDMSAQFVGAFVVGIIYSAIISLFLRSKK